MEAVTADAVFFKVFMWDCVQVGFFIHAHTEGGIEYSNVWFAWAYFFASFNTHQVCRVVQRTQVEALADSSFNIVVDNDGFGELCAAVEYAVTDCVDFLNRSDNTVVFVGQGIQNQFYSYGMVWHWGFNNIVVFARNFVGQNGTFDADSLTQTFCQNVLVLHINQLIFQRGASAVHYKNFHIKFLHSFLKPSTQKGGKAD